jgi:hypothetical protein
MRGNMGPAEPATWWFDVSKV